jgi:hypothetical protein
MKTRIAINISHKNSVAILNELFAKLDCSLARYLTFARPWVPRRNMLVDAVVRRLSYEHEIFASNIARLIYDRRGAVQSCVFPMGFTSFNDLSLEYLAPRVLEYERALLATAEESAEQLNDDPDARRVVSKIAVSLRRYVDLLAELLSPILVAPAAAEENGDASLHQKATPWTAKERFDQAVAEPKTAA